MRKGLLRTFLANDSGATAIEYALIAGIVSVSIIGGLKQISSSMKDAFGSVAAAFGSSGSSQ